MQKLPALFIGRFQPFHNGHLSVVRQALAENDFLILGIGSAEDNYLPDNPFTASERWEMITAALNEANISHEKYTIIPVRNINHYALWVEHVEKLVPPFETVYTGSPLVKQLFQDHGRHTVVDAHFKHDISGTQIRTLIKQNSSQWETFVPSAVVNYLKPTGKIHRLNII